jgi:hypothetical protein
VGLLLRIDWGKSYFAQFAVNQADSRKRGSQEQDCAAIVWNLTAGSKERPAGNLTMPVGKGEFRNCDGPGQTGEVPNFSAVALAVILRKQVLIPTSAKIYTRTRIATRV